jgi:hypothetical protein
MDVVEPSTRSDWADGSPLGLKQSKNSHTNRGRHENARLGSGNLTLW